MKDIKEIKVFSPSESYVENGDFENLSSGDDIFANWVEENNVTNIISKAVGIVGTNALSIETVSGSGSYVMVKQAISNLSAIEDKKLILSFVAKSSHDTIRVGYIVNSVMNMSQIINKSIDAWNYYSIEIDLSSLTDPLTSFSVVLSSYLEVVLYDDVKLYYIKEELLEKENIIAMDDLELSIEDELFTFTANDISMTLLNEHNTGYMNPMDFINKDVLYAIEIRYQISNGDDRWQYLFTNWDNCSRKQTFETDEIELSFFELSGLLSDQNWYLGKYIQNEDDPDDGVNIFSTEYPLILDKNSPLNINNESEDLLNDKLLPVIKSVIVGNKLPFYPENIDIEIEDNLLSDVGFVSNLDDYFHPTDSGKEIIMDIFKDKDERIYVIAIPNDFNLGMPITGVNISLYEIKNGTTVTFVDSIPLKSEVRDIAFYHRWDVEVTNDDESLIIIQIGNFSMATGTATGSYYRDYYKYENNVYIHNKDKTNGFYQPSIESYRAAYIDSTGHTAFSGGINNSLCPENYGFDLFGGNYRYTGITDTTYSNNVSSSIALRYITGLEFTVPKFPKYLHLSGDSQFSDSTLAGVMRELCVTQDALWYFKYIGGGRIVIYIRRRSMSGYPGNVTIDAAVQDCDTKEIATNLSNITFDDISSSIYSNDPNRIRIFREWYNAKYGGGKKQFNLTMWDKQDYSLGAIILMRTLEENQITVMIKKISWNDEDDETTIELFQIGSN